MSEAVDAGRLITKIGEDGYVRQRGDFLDISEDGMSGHCYILVSTKADKETQLTAENAEMQEQLNKNHAQIKILEERIEHLEGDYDHYESFDEGYRSAGADLEIAKRMRAMGMMDFLRNLQYEDYPVQAAEELYNSFK